jgi:hypothetical protein
MTLSEFIKKLQDIEANGHGDKPVKLADWSECYGRPNESAAENIAVSHGDVVIG